MFGKLYMIPVPLAPDALNTIPASVQQQTIHLRYFFVEQVRTARRYLKSIDKSVDIDAIHFAEMNQQRPPDTELLLKWLKEGHDVGVMSEAGCPGMADPGSALVAKAQEIGASVIPLTGPSSVLLALMASGFNGQGFRFVGYLPVKEPLRGKAMKELEQLSAARNETQIFIETPYRNNQLLQELIKHCKPSAQLCIARDITGEHEFIKTATIAYWKNNLPELHKMPVVFLLMG
jgi:16S rRNA (cytidine1402-2'-O)-methyltransferase